MTILKPGNKRELKIREGNALSRERKLNQSILGELLLINREYADGCAAGFMSQWVDAFNLAHDELLSQGTTGVLIGGMLRLACMAEELDSHAFAGHDIDVLVLSDSFVPKTVTVDWRLPTSTNYQSVCWKNKCWTTLFFGFENYRGVDLAQWLHIPSYYFYRGIRIAESQAQIQTVVPDYTIPKLLKDLYGSPLTSGLKDNAQPQLRSNFASHLLIDWKPTVISGNNLYSLDPELSKSENPQFLQLIDGNLQKIRDILNSH